MKETSIIVVGIDPSYSNMGLVKGSLNLVSGVLSILDMHLQTTLPDSKNKVVRKSTQDLNRSRTMFLAIQEFVKGTDLVFVELPVGSQNARAMFSVGACTALIASISNALIQVTPTEVKVAATGLKTASKQQMIDWATTTYPNAGWMTKKVKGITSFISSNEHLADALAAIHAGIKTDEFKQARALLIK